MNSSVPALLQAFFHQYLAVERGLAENSILSYRDTFKLLIRYLCDKLHKAPDQIQIEDLSQHQTLDFLKHGEQVRGWTARTRNQRLAAIRSFWRYVAREHPNLALQAMQVRSIGQKKTQPKPPDYLEENQAQALLGAIDQSEPKGVRDYAIVLLLYNTGARVSEVIGLGMDDLRLDGVGQVHLIGKGAKPRSCPVWPQTVQALRNWFAVRRANDPTEQQLFLNARGQPLTRSGIRYLLKKHGVRAQAQCPSIKTRTLTPHLLRHTAAMHLIRAGNDLCSVGYWLGHVDLNTTHIYVEIDMDTKRRMLDKTHPPQPASPPPWRQPDILDWLNDLTPKAPVM